MLDVRELSVSYGQHRALEAVSLHVKPGEIVVILGANGAGKSSLLRTVGGLCEGTHAGQVNMDGHPVLGLPAHRIIAHGIALVPEGRGVFGDLTVQENLLLGAHSARARADQDANLDRVLSLFPKLGERRKQIVRTMSGGEQQMVAIGRAMMSAPSILMLDEPSLGLSPLLCKELFHSLRTVRDAGLGVLLVEQNARQSLAIADRGYLLENARITHEDSAARLMNDPAVQRAYLGGGPARPAATKPTTPTPSEIAAQAVAAGEGSSPLPRIQLTPRVPQRLGADQLIGESIAGLVQRAAQLHGGPVASPRIPDSAARPTVPAAGQDRLRAVLQDIEQAAVRARSRTRTPKR